MLVEDIVERDCKKKGDFRGKMRLVLGKNGRIGRKREKCGFRE